jgi:alkylhydroperoxidase family enzyme
MASHGAVASELANEELTRSVLADYRTAPISGKMKATLAFLEKLTLSPERITADDARAVRAAGVAEKALARAVYICMVLNVVNRLSQTLDFEIPPDKVLARRARLSVERLRVEGRIV